LNGIGVGKSKGKGYTETMPYIKYLWITSATGTKTTYRADHGSGSQRQASPWLSQSISLLIVPFRGKSSGNKEPIQ